MISGAKLDHLAVAAESWDDLWPRYRGDLGGEWVAGGPTIGFASAQVRYRNGMKIEALMPYEWERNDFLRRFLDHRGAGPHHLTFKVPDIEAALATTEAAGYRPVGVDLSDPGWKEAFLHPKDAPGVVIQLAQAPDEWHGPEPDGFPEAARQAATLDYVGHAVAHLEQGVRLYRDLLGAHEAGRGEDELLAAAWIDYAWPTGVIRLFDAPHLSQGVHHVAFTVADAPGVPDAQPTGDGRYEVPAEANFGTRLVLRDVAS